MSDIHFIKLSVGIFDDEKIRLIEAMPDADALLVIWFKLLVQAGRCNSDGNVTLSEGIHLNDEMLSTLFGRPIGTIRLALKTFQRMGMISNGSDGTIAITNWSKHQNLQALERIREQGRLRVAKHREKQKLLGSGNATVTLRHAIERRRKKEEYTDDFLSFYNAYPLKIRKRDAFKSWRKIKPENGIFDKIMVSLEQHKNSEQWRKDNGKFIPHPSTWLNGERWEDEIQPASSPALPGKESWR